MHVLVLFFTSGTHVVKFTEDRDGDDLASDFAMLLAIPSIVRTWIHLVLFFFLRMNHNHKQAVASCILGVAYATSLKNQWEITVGIEPKITEIGICYSLISLMTFSLLIHKFYYTITISHLFFKVFNNMCIKVWSWIVHFW